MHDCPGCQVPLHGHEQFCPSCGTKQFVRPEFGALFKKQQNPSNPVPLILTVVALGIVLIFAIQSSWIGKVLTRGPVQPDPVQSLSPLAARQAIEEKLTANLASVGATGKFSWMAGEQPGDINSPGILSLRVDTQLSDPNSRRSIIDPVKEYMEPGKVSTLIMNDSRSHATWTYTMTPASVKDDDAAQLNPDGAESDNTSSSQ